MLSPVSFGNVSKTYSPEEFQQLISKPQVYSVQTTAVASTPVEEKAKSKNGTFKKILIGIAAVAATAILLAEGAKRGKFNVSADANKYVKAIMNGLNSAGTAINRLFSSAGSKIAEGAAKSKEALANAADTVTDMVQDATQQVAETATQAKPSVTNALEAGLEIAQDAAEAVVK